MIVQVYIYNPRHSTDTRHSSFSQPGACAFEDANLCSWHVEASEDLAWQLTDGQESHDHGPQTDHTTNTMTGKVVSSYAIRIKVLS